MIAEFTDIWVYLRAEPLLLLTVTLAAYVAAQWVYECADLNPLLNPVAIAVILLAALLAGAVTAVTTAVGVAALLGASFETLASLAPKSVTTPIAMGISERIGGLPSLTAVLVILTGILGAMLATPVLNLLGITDWKARGFAAGVAAHGIGTARAFHVSEVAGTFAGIAMGLNGLLTAFLVPLPTDLFAPSFSGRRPITLHRSGIRHASA